MRPESSIELSDLAIETNRRLAGNRHAGDNHSHWRTHPWAHPLIRGSPAVQVSANPPQRTIVGQGLGVGPVRWLRRRKSAAVWPSASSRSVAEAAPVLSA